LSLAIAAPAMQSATARSQAGISRLRGAERSIRNQADEVEGRDGPDLGIERSREILAGAVVRFATGNSVSS
jgi:hypothetical protein